MEDSQYLASESESLSPRVCNNYLVSKLKESGSHIVRRDPWTFKSGDKRSLLKINNMLGVHVDDISSASSSADCDAFGRFTRESLPMKFLRELTCCTACVFESN